MAAVGTSSTDFLFGDDLDAIFEALDEDEEFNDYLRWPKTVIKCLCLILHYF